MRREGGRGRGVPVDTKVYTHTHPLPSASLPLSPIPHLCSILAWRPQSFMEDFLESSWATGGEGMRPGQRPCLGLSGLMARLPGGSALALRLYLHQQPRIPVVCFVFVFYDQTNAESVRVLEKWKIGWEPFDRAVGLSMWPCLGWQEGRRGSWGQELAWGSQRRGRVSCHA